jgi:glycosyltransferase involved in cell wall biosynthesis
MREELKNEEVLVVFGDVITRNRAAHIFKIVKILLGLGKKPIVLVSRATIDATNDLAKDLPRDAELLFLDSKKAVTDNAKSFLLKEWMLHLVQLLRLRNAVKSSKSVIVMGTLNLPVAIIAQLHGKKTYVFAGGFAYLIQKAQSVGYGGRNVLIKYIIGTITYLIEALVMLLANYIIVESKSIRNYIPLYCALQRTLPNKVIDYGALFIDTQYFKPYIPIDKKEEVVGYIGSLEHHRAVLELILTFKIIARLRTKTRFLIIGSGPLFDDINKMIEKDQVLKNRVTLLRYVPHKDIPYYMNQIKVFVFLTRSEGLPNTILEALASGCIVLSTGIGGIPDIIKNGETGFLLQGELEPKNIAKHIVSILDMPREKLIVIYKKGRTCINHYFSINSALRRWKRILEISTQSDLK